ncbi:hypothetical protein AB0H77_30055 [Streptomyces sp. NPDC050844]
MFDVAAAGGQMRVRAELMTALEADSRFQAGVHASRLGLTGSWPRS